MTRLVGAVAREAWPLGVAAAAFTIAVGLPASDPDMWWHLASGRWMVEHRDVLRVDVFSATVTGTPYALGESLGEVLLYLTYAAGSWSGVAVLRAALVALASYAVSRVALRFAPARVALPLAVVAVVLSKPTWTDRPQLFTLALFALTLELLFAARAGSRRALVATVPLVLVWSALHPGYAIGLALIWLFGLAALVERRDATAFLVAAFLATVVVTVDPVALSLARTVGHVGSAMRGIVEESPVDVLTPFGALFALVLAGSLFVLLIEGGDVLTVFVLVPVLGLALTAQRYIPLFGIAAVPFVARSLAALISRAARDTARSSAREPFTPSASAAFIGVLWIGAIASIATADPRPDLRAYPVVATTALRTTSGIVLNEYDWGGYLIWNVPQRPVFVDGRLYPFLEDDALGGYRRAINVLTGWHSVLDRWNVTQALLKQDRPLAQALRDEGWTVLAEDRLTVLLQRPR